MATGSARVTAAPSAATRAAAGGSARAHIERQVGRTEARREAKRAGKRRRSSSCADAETERPTRRATFATPAQLGRPDGTQRRQASTHTQKATNNKSAKKRGRSGRRRGRAGRRETGRQTRRLRSLNKKRRIHGGPGCRSARNQPFFSHTPSPTASPHAQHNRSESSVWDNVMRTSATSQTVERRALFFFFLSFSVSTSLSTATSDPSCLARHPTSARNTRETVRTQAGANDVDANPSAFHFCTLGGTPSRATGR